MFKSMGYVLTAIGVVGAVIIIIYLVYNKEASQSDINHISEYITFDPEISKLVKEAMIDNKLSYREAKDIICTIDKIKKENSKENLKNKMKNL